MIETFPENAAEFYARRDDRTNRCLGERRYQTVGCLVSVAPEVLETPTGQALFITSCNLLSRWCRGVELLIGGKDPQLINGGSSSLGVCRSTLALMKDADPFGSFEAVDRPSGSCRLQLHIGSRLVRYAEHVVVATAHGWDAGLATDTDPSLEFSCNGNVLGAIGSACVSGAQLFKLAVDCDRALLLQDGIVDFFRMQRLKSAGDRLAQPLFDSNIGHVLLIGSGSVGSAAAYFMQMASLSAEMTIIERDTVKVENFNRSPIFGRNTFGLNKGRALERFLGGGSLKVVDLFEDWWDEFIRQRGRVPNAYDVWLPLANEFGVRWSIQNNYPPPMVHASTGVNWSVNFGRHIPMRDDCLADRFPENTPDAALGCATGHVPTATKQIDAALPFLSFFAGFLIAADLCRINAPEYPQVPNYALFDFGGTMESIQSWDRKPAEECLCKKQIPRLCRRWNGETKFAHLLP